VVPREYSRPQVNLRTGFFYAEISPSQNKILKGMIFMAWSVSLLVVFFVVTIGVGIYCRRHSTDVSGFVLGGRSVGPWLTAFAYGTSYFSAVIFVGYAGQFGWRFGIASTWIGIGNAFIGSLLAWKVLGRRTRLMTQHIGSATMPDFFGKRFKSPALKIAASVLPRCGNFLLHDGMVMLSFCGSYG
jgi:Na+/proline symporter